MKVSDFNYNLPIELIAQVPIKDRDQSRLMVLDRKNKTIEHKIFKDIIDYFYDLDERVNPHSVITPTDRICPWPLCNINPSRSHNALR